MMGAIARKVLGVISWHHDSDSQYVMGRTICVSKNKGQHCHTTGVHVVTTVTAGTLVGGLPLR
jgi:hypothetical protein